MKTAENLKRQLGGVLRSARRIFVTAIIAMLLTTSLMTQARTYADDVIPQSLGDLDISFGNGGKVMTQVKAGTTGGSSASAVAIQNDGTLVVAGGVYATGPGSRIPNSYDFGLARYQTDGSLDTNFGSSGKINTNFFGFDDSAVAVVVQADGKIIAAGEAQKSADALSSDFGLARYNADGSLDVTFGDGGKVLTDFFGFSDVCRALAFQPDGKIVAAGNAATSGTSGNTFALARYNPDGSLDATFGTGGKVTAEFLVGSNPVCYALLVQPDGKIIGVGNSGVGIALARYNSNGTLDSSFGAAGKTTTTIAFPNSVSASAAALQPDGRIVVAGSEYHKVGSTAFALARYTSNGVLDSSFGNSGLVATSVLGYDRAYAVSVRPDGKIVAAGQVSVYTSNDGGDFGLAQYNPDGTLDTSFGSGGVIHTDVHGGFFDRANAMVVQPDSRIVLAGGTDDSNGVGQQVALARYGVATLPPAARLPVIQGATIQGKQLIVTGFNYDIAAKIFVDGEKQKTANDDQQPENRLIALKAGKFIAHGQTVIVTVKNTDGRLSNSFTFTRP
jgi:uncharacterized delta-60 repeat protein